MFSNNKTASQQQMPDTEEAAPPRDIHYASKMIVTQRVPDMGKPSKRRTDRKIVKAPHAVVTAPLGNILFEKRRDTKTYTVFLMPPETAAEEKQRLAAAAMDSALSAASLLIRDHEAGDLPERVEWTWSRICRLCLPGHGFGRNGVPLVVMCGAPFVFRPRTDEPKGRGKFSSFPIVRLGYNPEAHRRLLGRSGIEGLGVRE